MPGRGGRAFGRIADWFIPGNAYNSTMGRWNPATAKTGIAGIIADQFIPGGSNIVGMGARNGMFGSDFARDLRNEGIYNTMADQYRDFRGEVANQWLNPRIEAGGNPQVTVGQPQTVQTGGGVLPPMMPTTPPVTAQAPWSGLGTSTGNVFSGGMLGSWANGGQQQRQYGQAAGSFTPWGAGVYQNDKWGETAAGFGVGMTSGNGPSQYAISDALTATAKNKGYM